MTTSQNIITPEIRDAILASSSHATSKDEVTRAIFDALVDAGVDWTAVPLDEVKPVLVDALRSACDNPLAA